MSKVEAILEKIKELTASELYELLKKLEAKFAPEDMGK